MGLPNSTLHQRKRIPQVHFHILSSVPRCLCGFAAASLEGSMGNYGRPHIDDKDSPGHYTNMTVHSDIPAGYNPGRFHIFGLGICINLDNFTSINFSGLHYHGGSPPTAPPGEKPVHWAYRFVLILYPPLKMTDGSARLVLAALPKNREFHLLPEMTNLS